MKKLCVEATMVVVITGFASTALAGDETISIKKCDKMLKSVLP